MKKKIIAFAVMVMTIMMSVSFIYAADGDSCKLELNVSTKELKAGDTVDVTVNRIRDKIEKDKANPKILITKRGVGYYVVGNK